MISNELKTDHYGCDYCGDNFHIDELDTVMNGDEYEYCCPKCADKGVLK